VAEAESTAATRESRLKMRFMVALWMEAAAGRRKDCFLALGRESARVKRLFAAEWLYWVGVVRSSFFIG
jgi:hypothetical protein